jgi:putative phosphoesterase
MKPGIQVGIFSDTHGWLDPRLKIEFADCQAVWHAGDIGDVSVCKPWSGLPDFRAVYGNIDGDAVRRLYPEYQAFDIEGFRVLMLHIAGKHPRLTARCRELVNRYRPGMLVCGHSHICRVVKEGGLLYVNPGAAGKHGFHLMRTALKIRFQDGKPTELRVLELGPRVSSDGCGEKEEATGL